MAVFKYALDPGGPQRLTISISLQWNNAVVALDGKPLGEVATRKELEEGREFQAEDGTHIRVQLVRSGVFPWLKVERNGQPVPSRFTQPATRGRKNAASAAFILAILVLYGAFTLLQAQAPDAAGQVYLYFGLGVAYALLGIFIWRGSLLAFALTVVTHTADTGW